MSQKVSWMAMTLTMLSLPPQKKTHNISTKKTAHLVHALEPAETPTTPMNKGPP